MIQAIAPLSTRQQSHLDEIRGHYPRGFTLIDLSNARVFHDVPFGDRGWVVVIGDGNRSLYEFVIRHDGDEARYLRSDSGYGSPAQALRDGLFNADV